MDLEKVYDWLSWKFLYDTLFDIGFDQGFVISSFDVFVIAHVKLSSMVRK